MKVQQASQDRTSTRYPESLYRFLGCFSIALGAMQITAPNALARFIGVRNRPWLFGALGVREIACGISILSQSHPRKSLWGRVLGDLMDLGMLSVAQKRRGDHPKVAAAAAAVVGVTALDWLAACEAEKRDHSGKSGNTFVHVITIERSRQELYDFWRKFGQLPTFMRNLKSVKESGDGRSHWVAKGPMNSDIEWDAEIIQDKPGELITWRSLPGADVEHAGTVRFSDAPGGRGTVVQLHLKYHLPGGWATAKAAKAMGESPEQLTRADLFRFKQLMEAGEITTTEGQPVGRSKNTSMLFDRILGD